MERQRGGLLVVIAGLAIVVVVALALLVSRRDPAPSAGPTGPPPSASRSAGSQTSDPHQEGDGSAPPEAPGPARKVSSGAGDAARIPPAPEVRAQQAGFRVRCQYERDEAPAVASTVELLDASRQRMASGLTDAEGIASLAMPETGSEWVLRARTDESSDPRASSSGERLVTAEELAAASGSGAPLRLTLHEQVALTGIVESTHEGPVPGAVVGVRPAGVVFGGQTIGAVEPVATDADGTFELLLPGVPCNLIVEVTCADGRAQTKLVSHPGAAGAPIRFLLGEQSQGYRISGTVVGLDGDALEGAQVLLLADPGTTEAEAVAPSPDGGFAFEPEAPGRYLLAARSGPFMSREPIPAVIDEDVRTAFVVLPLDETASVEGRIVRPDGEPWAEIPVGGYPTRGSGESRWLIESGFSTLSQLELTHTDGDGRFRLVGLLDDYEYELVCIPDPERPRNWVREGPIAPGSTDVLIVIDEARIRGGVLAGTAFREPQREAIDQMYFFLSDRSAGRPWRPISKKVHLEEGTFRLEGLVVGNEYFVEALVADAGRLTIGPWIASLEEHQVELVFGMDGSARITAQYDDGQPGKGWILSMVEAGDGPRTPFQREPSGAAGTAEFKPLAAGVYLLSAKRDGRVVGPVELEIEPGRCSELRIDLGAR